MLSTMLASVAGLGLVGHQAGFVLWDMEGVDLGLTQVAHAGSEFGHPRGTAGVWTTPQKCSGARKAPIQALFQGSIRFPF